MILLINIEENLMCSLLWNHTSRKWRQDSVYVNDSVSQCIKQFRLYDMQKIKK